MKRRFWAIWCKSLGNKISECDKESDIGCILRTIYAIIIIVTSGFIIANAYYNMFGDDEIFTVDYKSEVYYLRN